jgi:CHAT domain-containing protein
LRHAVATVELVRQTEMQDFLGDRCAVEAVQGGRDLALPAQTALLYPVMLPDRLELLLDTGSTLLRRTVGVGSDTLQSSVRAFADALRNDRSGFDPYAAELYDWLLRPFADVLGDGSIETLVFVPDGVLRLIPIDALFDGRQFVIERFATATVIGMSMTSGAAPSRRLPRSLVAGMSEPGPVVAKLDAAMVERIIGTPAAPGASIAPAASTEPATSRWLRSPRASASRGGAAAPADPAQRAADLRAALALPGVKDEIDTVATIVDGDPLLDAGFTIANFQQRAGSGNYRIVHIASHGVFGGSASESFIMAYDDLLTLDDLQAVLRSEKFQNNPIELLSLSACETAEGDDRSPLGISGAAIKARARSVLGTLWPVNDRAATMVMERFYTGLQSGTMSKAEALRRARLAVLRTEGFARPFYWAPFILIGSWR